MKAVMSVGSFLCGALTYHTFSPDNIWALAPAVVAVIIAFALELIS